MDDFKPWRRKIGVVTLVMACAMMAGWVRSIHNYDVVECFPCETIIMRLNSWDGNLCYVHCITEKVTIWSSFGLSTTVVESFENDFPFDKQFTKTRWVWRLGRIGVATSMDDESDSITAVVAPYWLIAFPLALLSAWLLLSKPRPAKLRESPITTAN